DSNDPAGPRVSLRRVVLLLMFGASACMALTTPGRWVAWKLLPERRPSAWMPLRLQNAPHTDRLSAALVENFADMQENADHAVGTLPAPTEARLVERLANLDGWRSCVIFEFGSTPAEIEAAGIADRQACVAIADSCGRLSDSPKSVAAARS